jgi:hypothetical protein
MNEPPDPIRVIIAVLGALVLYSGLSQVLEYSLVRAAGGDGVTTIDAYLAVLNRLPILATKASFNLVVGVLVGYIAAKVVATRPLTFVAMAAVLETCSLAWGSFAGEYAVLPLWYRLVLLATTGPAFMAGAWVQLQAETMLGADDALAAERAEPRKEQS